ncbi:MAG: serine/threonine protein kinase [Polyangiaceae bacterium]|nr:serine/threonine protein kinase [Polyangiaceae bacterium]
MRPLSAGGMGSVWVAKHVELDVEVAVKLISWVQALKPVAVERFKREARAAAQIRSPHVVQILDYGIHDGVPYMAMELLAGQDLYEYLEGQPHGRVAPRRTLEILRPICKALALAHQAGIVHRDIKPANVFLADSGGEEVVKVLGFGIAKETSRNAQHTTGTGLVGSPLYMSPEQMKGSDVDRQTDLWSVAVVLYEMLAGVTPYDAPALPALFQTVANQDAPPISSKLEELAPFDEFFRRGLSREKATRFETTRELLAGFEAACAGEGVVLDPVVAAAPRTSPVASIRAGASSSTAALAPTAEVPALKAAEPKTPSHTGTLDALSDLPSSDALARPRDGTSGKTARNIVLGIAAVGLLGVGLYFGGAFGGGAPTGAGVGARAEPSTGSPAPITSEAAPGGVTVDPTPVVSADSSPSASAVASASATPSAHAAPITASGGRPSGQGATPPKQPPTAQTGNSSTTDPIWGVEVSKPKR